MANEIRHSYVKCLVEKSSGRSRLLSRGNQVFDNLAASRGQHTSVTGLAFWDQPTLCCYTPMPRFHACHSLLPTDFVQTDAAGRTLSFPPVPDLSALPYPAVTWKRTQGAAGAYVVLPDGPFPVTCLKIMPPPDGTAWTYQTDHLPDGWRSGYNATGDGALPENGGVAITLRIGKGDLLGPGTTLLDALQQVFIVATEADLGVLLGTRVIVGGLWAVLFSQNGDPPVFQKKFRYRDEEGVLHQWVSLHHFTGATPQTSLSGGDEWLVSFCIVDGRLSVSVNGRDFYDSGFVFSETEPASGKLKRLKIASAPVMVAGAGNDGAPVYVGLRRIGWGQEAAPGQPGTFRNRVSLNEAVGTASDITVKCAAFVPAGAPPPSFALSLAGATSLTYKASLGATPDDREPVALKWVLLTSPRLATPESADFVDYGPAIRDMDEDGAEPDFAGTNESGSKSAWVSIEFDRVLLDQIAAANATDWRQDLAAYSPVTWVVGNKVETTPGVLTDQETTRIQGYLMRPSGSQEEYGMGSVRRDLVDPSVRLTAPAGFIDTSYTSLEALTPSGTSGLYGWEAAAYILGQAIDPTLGAALKVYMPRTWGPLFDEAAMAQSFGKMPANDLPLWSPPYGSSADKWLETIRSFDYAALFFRGLVPIYGQWLEIVRGSPTHDLYDSANADGTPNTGTLPPEQQPWLIVKSEMSLDTANDYTRFVVWGQAPGGLPAGANGAAVGAPLITAQATDFARESASWPRTSFTTDGRFYTKEGAQQFVRTALKLAGGEKAAQHYRVTLPYLKHEVFWGDKCVLHTPSVPELNGKTLRVLKVKLRRTADGATGIKASTQLDLIEMLADEM